MTTRLKLSLLFLFIFQILVSLTFELAHDEAYYWLYSTHLDWGNFDHPPFVGMIIRIFSFLGHSEFAVRFGFIILQFLTALIVLKTVPQKKRLLALALFFAFPIASIGGMLALPDMPLLFMTAIYIWLLKNYLEKDNFRNSSHLGFSIACLFYAKYHGVLLIFFTMLAIPRLFLRKSFYFVALVAIAGFFPHLWWQYKHEFATLRYHFIDRPSSSFSFKRSVEFVFLQMILAGLFAGPILWWSIVKNKTQSDFLRALKFVSIGTVFFFLISSFSKKTEANWTIFLTVPLIILTLQTEIWERKWARNLLFTSSFICLLARLIFIFNPSQLPLKRLAEFKGWKNWAQNVLEACGPERTVMANSYQVAAKLSFYLNRDVTALNYRSRRNQFDYWRFEETQDGPVCYLTDKKFEGQPIQTPEGKILKVVKFDLLPESLKARNEH